MVEINQSIIGNQLKAHSNDGKINCKVVEKPFYDPNKKIATS